MAWVYFTQGWNGVTFPKVGDEIGEIVGDAYVEIYWTEEPGVNVGNMAVRLLHRKVNQASDMAAHIAENVPSGSWQSLPFDSSAVGSGYSLNLKGSYGWDFTVNKSVPENPVTHREPHFPLCLVTRASVPDGSGYDGVEHNQSLARINNLNLKIEFNPIGINDFYIAGSGSMYGSFIDDVGRSNSYNEGDVIKDPAFIIEDLLRTHISLGTADIDTASFDAAANSSVESRLNIHAENKDSVNAFIKRIAEQSTFTFCYTSSGQARLIPLNDTSPTTTRIIPFSHIKNGKIKITKTKTVSNVLDVQHRFLQEFGGAFQDFTNFTNAASQTAHGDEVQDAAWENITGDSVTHIGDYLVGNADGLWANEHVKIDIELVGFTGIDLEVGDYIELDATSCDPQVKPYGESWAGKQFLVIEPTHQMDSSKIKAIQLY